MGCALAKEKDVSVPKSIFERFVASEDGATAIEYALLGTLIAIALIASFTLVGNSVTNMFGTDSTGAAAAINTATETL